MARVVTYDQMGIMSRALEAASTRHRVLADNLANVNTPGFRRGEVQFESLLARALDGPQPLELTRTDPRHLPARGRVTLEDARPRILVRTDRFARNDRSNVNPEVEMVEMAKNTMWAQALSARTRQMIQGMREIIARSGGA